jgi:hypothetical protein
VRTDNSGSCGAFSAGRKRGKGFRPADGQVQRAIYPQDSAIRILMGASQSRSQRTRRRPSRKVSRMMNEEWPLKFRAFLRKLSGWPQQKALSANGTRYSKETLPSVLEDRADG